MRCRQCDADNPSTNAFCGSCGARLEPAPAAMPAAAPGGERKRATVLFADIVGSTSLVAGLDPEEAMTRLQPVVTAMAATVRRFDGTVLRTMGDGIMAAFGAPRAQEGHALLACKAALAMQEALSAVEGAPTIRIGIHSGEVVTGAFDIGPSAEQDTLSGAAVHLASRLEQLAKPGAICISRDCRNLVHAYCDTSSLGLHSIKGFAQPVEVHRLIGLKPAVASEAFLGAELTRFEGRESELAVLQRALAEAEQGKASVIGISAPAGVGKSRLCYEFAERCRRRHVDVLEARASIYGHATPLQPVLEMLRAFFRISSTDDAAVARRKMARRLIALDLSFEDDLPLLGEFLGIGDPERPLPRLDPRARHARLRDIVRRMIRAEGRPVSVTVVEDLHWLDEASGDFIETMVEAIAGTCTVLVLNFRPSYAASWMSQPYYHEIALAELDPPEIDGLVRGLVGDRPDLDEICANVADRSGGNPFFAEELVRSLAESGALVGRRGDYRPGASLQETRLPPTAEAVIGARIDRLADREKALLQIGATIGKEVPLALLEAVAAMPRRELETLLERLGEAGLLLERASVAGRSFAFRHPLIQEVAYAMQLRSRRTALHAAVAGAIERLDWGQLDEFAGLLAHHCEAAGEPLEAARHLQRAATWVGKTNSAQALKHWKKVRWLLRDQPRSDTNDRLRALAAGQILNFGWREGIAAEEAKPLADEALRYARETGDKMHEPLLLGAYGRILAASGAADEYVAVVREALALTAREGDGARTATVNGMLSQANFLAGLLGEALAANDAGLAAIAAQRGLEGSITLGLNVGQILGFDVEHWIKCLRTRILVNLGRFAEAEEWLAEVLDIAPGRVDPVVQFVAHAAVVDMAARRGDAATALRHAARVHDYAEQSAIPYLRVVALGCAGLAKAAAADFAGGARELRQAIEHARRAKAGLEFEPRLLADLAETHQRAGQHGVAAEVAGEAIEVARRRTARVAECQASIVRAVALLAAGAGAAAGRHEAEELLGRAERLLRASGAGILEPLLAHARARLGGAVEESRCAR